MLWQKGSYQILDHPEQYKGDVNGVIERFSSHHIAEEYERVFQEVLKGS